MHVLAGAGAGKRVGLRQLLVHRDDAVTDSYWLMDPMTVFGFGRQGGDITRLLSATPDVLVLGLRDSRDAAVLGAELATLVAAGALEPSP